MPNRPTSDLVLRAFLTANVPAVLNRVAAVLPEDRTTWRDFGFLQFASIGGTPEPGLQQRRPVYSLRAYATAPDSASARPDWAKANALIEEIITLEEKRNRLAGGFARPVLPAAFTGAIVQNFVIHSEPRRIPGNPTGYARFDLDVELWWTPLAGTF